MEEREFSLQGRRLAVIGSCVFCRNGHSSSDCTFMNAHSNGGSRQHELLYWLLTSLDVNWIDKSLLFISLRCYDISLYNAPNISNSCSCYMVPFSLSQIFCLLCYLVLCVLSCVQTSDPRRICSILFIWFQSVSVCQGVAFPRYTRVLSGIPTKPPLQHLRLKRGGRTSFPGNKWVKGRRWPLISIWCWGWNRPVWSSFTFSAPYVFTVWW